jgi:hypothetical protein
MKDRSSPPAKTRAARANAAATILMKLSCTERGDAMKIAAAIERRAPKMRANAIALTDNIFTSKKNLRPYVAPHARSRERIRIRHSADRSRHGILGAPKVTHVTSIKRQTSIFRTG